MNASNIDISKVRRAFREALDAEQRPDSDTNVPIDAIKVGAAMQAVVTLLPESITPDQARGLAEELRRDVYRRELHPKSGQRGAFDWDGRQRINQTRAALTAGAEEARKSGTHLRPHDLFAATVAETPRLLELQREQAYELRHIRLLFDLKTTGFHSTFRALAVLPPISGAQVEELGFDSRLHGWIDTRGIAMSIDTRGNDLFFRREDVLNKGHNSSPTNYSVEREALSAYLFDETAGKRIRGSFAQMNRDYLETFPVTEGRRATHEQLWSQLAVAADPQKHLIEAVRRRLPDIKEAGNAVWVALDLHRRLEELGMPQEMRAALQGAIDVGRGYVDYARRCENLAAELDKLGKDGIVRAGAGANVRAAVKEWIELPDSFFSHERPYATVESVLWALTGETPVDATAIAAAARGVLAKLPAEPGPGQLESLLPGEVRTVCQLAVVYPDTAAIVAKLDAVYETARTQDETKDSSIFVLVALSSWLPAAELLARREATDGLGTAIADKIAFLQQQLGRRQAVLSSPS